MVGTGNYTFDCSTQSDIRADNLNPSNNLILINSDQSKLPDCYTGTTQMAHMLENNGGDGVHFTADELISFNTEVAKIEINGLRLPQMVLNFSGVEAPSKKQVL